MLDCAGVVVGVVVVTVWVTVGVLCVVVAVGVEPVVGPDAAVLCVEEPHALTVSAAASAAVIRHMACEYLSRSGRTPRACWSHRVTARTARPVLGSPACSRGRPGPRPLPAGEADDRADVA